MNDERTPILVGTAQFVERNIDPAEATEPLLMLEKMARGSAEDSGAGDALLGKLDTVAVLNVAGWEARNPAQVVADKIGAPATKFYTSEMGGQIGVTAVNVLAERIVKGESQAALLAGCNNMRTLMKAGPAGVELNWTTGGTSDPEMIGTPKNGSSELEGKYGMIMPPDVYPIFENALRASLGLSLEEHNQRIGKLFQKFSAVAAGNPHAWFPVERSVEELITPQPTNRMIAYPYTKFLNAILNTDQAAGMILTTVAMAQQLGIPEDRWVYWLGGAESEEEAWYPTERPDFSNAPAMGDTSRSALANAAVGVDEIDHIDFYSCFPVAVEQAAKQLDLDVEDPRGFTVTGGLPYAGGPASAYTLHSLASMADKLRDTGGGKGLVTGNGWYLTKHSASVWSTEAGQSELRRGLIEDLPSRDLDTKARPSTDDVSGPATISAYTVQYDRDGAPQRGILVGDTAAGERFIANAFDPSVLQGLVTSEGVGVPGTLSKKDELTIFSPS
ncbi:MAG: acetyl-CoA acetyltransferase [Candidatus Binatia bacterium]|nr:acetyl-CoA acetyltransferase [Candidatus Binatia bacterium]MDG1960008.1 acetyl-CoA acetyltransferase [Candidatus Binatia bacterium]MDG2009794.1 acetyl-CoA acetyltransferase [Candidatus Binatia bacterium]